MRNIRELLNENKDKTTYIYLANDEIGKKFMQQAENEGFLFGDKVKPTERNYSRVMAARNDLTINYVGAMGMMAFGSGKDDIVRVDFEKYLSGTKNYRYNG